MVISGVKSKKSARVLEDLLEQLDYDGPLINWGLSSSKKTGTVNAAEAVANAVNKRVALEMMADAGVSTPYIYSEPIASDYPVIGRPDHHSKGRWLYKAYGPNAFRKAKSARRHAPTHWLHYIRGAREFRVHIVNGESIKISEKIGGGNHDLGAIFKYPEDFKYNKSLRELAKSGVEALQLDFGAVDILWKDETGYILEVNTAPRLTDENSDTLQRYGEAFVRNYNE